MNKNSNVYNKMNEYWPDFL